MYRRLAIQLLLLVLVSAGAKAYESFVPKTGPTEKIVVLDVSKEKHLVFTLVCLQGLINRNSSTKIYFDKLPIRCYFDVVGEAGPGNPYQDMLDDDLLPFPVERPKLKGQDSVLRRSGYGTGHCRLGGGRTRQVQVPARGRHLRRRCDCQSGFACEVQPAVPRAAFPRRQERGPVSEDEYNKYTHEWIRRTIANSAEDGKPLFMVVRAPEPRGIMLPSRLHDIQQRVLNDDEIKRNIHLTPPRDLAATFTFWKQRHTQ